MGSLAGLAGPLGLDPADRVGGGPADGAAGVDAPEGDFLPGDHDDAGVAGAPLGGDGLS